MHFLSEMTDKGCYKANCFSISIHSKSNMHLLFNSTKLELFSIEKNILYQSARIAKKEMKGKIKTVVKFYKGPSKLAATIALNSVVC